MKPLQQIFNEENKERKDLLVQFEDGTTKLFEYEAGVDFSLTSSDEEEFMIRSDYDAGSIYLTKNGIITKYFLYLGTVLNENNPVKYYEFVE